MDFVNLRRASNADIARLSKHDLGRLVRLAAIVYLRLGAAADPPLYAPPAAGGSQQHVVAGGMSFLVTYAPGTRIFAAQMAGQHSMTKGQNIAALARLKAAILPLVAARDIGVGVPLSAAKSVHQTEQRRVAALAAMRHLPEDVRRAIVGSIGGSEHPLPGTVMVSRFGDKFARVQRITPAGAAVCVRLTARDGEPMPGRRPITLRGSMAVDTWSSVQSGVWTGDAGDGPPRYNETWTRA